MYKPLAFVAATVAALTASLASPVSAAPEQVRPTLTVRSSQWGRIVFDTRGRALYAFTRDRVGGTSTCYGACAVAWPPYTITGKLRPGPGIETRLLGTVRRRGGKRQVTYRGRPLYYYVSDLRPGQVTCQNVDEFGGLWLVVRPNGRLVR